MDWNLTKEQKMIKRSAHEFLSKKFTKELVRQLDDSVEGYAPELWQQMVDLGWLGLVFPEKYDGMSGSFLDLIILLEEMGNNICPGPFLSTTVLGGLPILNFGNEDQKEAVLPKISNGELIMTMAITEPGGGFDPDAINVTAGLEKDDFLINGTKLFVPDAHVADVFLCAVKTTSQEASQAGISVLLVEAKSPGIEITPLKTLARDKQCEIIFHDVRVSGENIVGSKNQGWQIVKDTISKAAVARSAEMIGGAQAAMDMALQYAKKRIQFDRPIGSFQAVQHYFADMWADIMGTRTLIYKAAWKISHNQPADLEAAMAKARTGEVFRRVTLLGHQLFGGIGFTQEIDMHLYHRRSMAGDLAFGNTDFQREIVARELGL